MPMMLLYQGGGTQVVITTVPGGGHYPRLLMLGVSLLPLLVMFLG